ncbi:hypothetical protein OHB41_31575 [Streptomyces sp. NBC_01571]|uniref:hypothetical protein n=1 Tax=Streptomyces sp. NBC_01571 TaxID=2975883 RepID=UPI00225934CB|nr:hypothetical protein [Streptomyces sp. NBC_01571]MCX4577646.1 hypothetical protein [Streptomyces sp. NBC_01571]
MRHLIRRATDGPHPPVPSGPDVLSAARIARVSGIEGRQVVLREGEFPYGTASGLWLALPERHVVVAQRPAPVRRITASPGQRRYKV